MGGGGGGGGGRRERRIEVVIFSWVVHGMAYELKVIM